MMKSSRKKLWACLMLAVLLIGHIAINTPLDVWAAGDGTVNVYALNIRSEGNTTSSILGVLGDGDHVSIISTANGWHKITATVDGKQVTGYVLSTYITSAETPSKPPVTQPQPQTQTRQVTGTVNLPVITMHTGASSRSDNLVVLSKNTKVEILKVNGPWYYVKTTSNGKTVYGYVYATHITSEGSTEEVAVENSDYERAVGIVDTDVLNLRSTPSTSGSILGTLKRGTVVQLLSQSGEWYYIYVTISGQGVRGYVSGTYLTTDNAMGQSVNEGDMSMDTRPQTKPEPTPSPSPSTTTTGRVDCSMLNVRSGPATTYRIVAYLYEDDIVTIKSEKSGWYEITALSNGKMIQGYVSADYIRITSGGTSISDAAFEQQIAAFPESYKSGLRMLHTKHPNWTFKLYDTGIDWETAVAQESKFGVCTTEVVIGSDTNFGQLSTESGAYDWSTDRYTVCDGSRWYSASKDLIKYYMDPRNFLEEKYIFCFEKLGYASTQRVSVVQDILRNTFMSGNYTETDPSTGKTYTKNYPETFMEAGKTSGASPYFLAARSFGENGAQGSGQTSGTYGSYKGYYNFYSIGASDGTDAQANGLRYAMKTNPTYLLPWNTRYKAIIGGAKFIAAEYINVGQDTNYFQKFNVSNKDSLYWHQYMTSVHGACSSAAMVYDTYKKYGIINQALEFTIPVYRNMPAAVCQKPYSGNPNPYLKSLTVNSGSYRLTPTFSYNVLNYSLVVPANVSQVTIAAQAVSPYAKQVAGTGSYTLIPGETKIINIVCTAGNGATKTYTLKIYRQK